jgi:hypothetical protein
LHQTISYRGGLIEGGNGGALTFGFAGSGAEVADFGRGFG